MRSMTRTDPVTESNRNLSRGVLGVYHHTQYSLDMACTRRGVPAPCSREYEILLIPKYERPLAEIMVTQSILLKYIAPTRNVLHHQPSRTDSFADHATQPGYPSRSRLHISLRARVSCQHNQSIQPPNITSLLVPPHSVPLFPELTIHQATIPSSSYYDSEYREQPLGGHGNGVLLSTHMPKLTRLMFPSSKSKGSYRVDRCNSVFHITRAVYSTFGSSLRKSFKQPHLPPGSLEHGWPHESLRQPSSEAPVGTKHSLTVYIIRRPRGLG